MKKYLLQQNTAQAACNVLVPRTGVTLLAIVAFVVLGVRDCRAEVVGSRVISGKKYYLDVVHGGPTQWLWLRVNPNACSAGDISVGQINAAGMTLGGVARQLCTWKTYYDNGKTIAGCTATGVTFGCGAATVLSDGAAASFCAAALRVAAPYAIRTGARDCVVGLRDKVLQSIMGDRNYAAFGLGAGIGAKKWTDATGAALDLACTFAP